MDNYISVEIIKKILGDQKYEELLNNISLEIINEKNLDIEISDFFDKIVSRYCMLILSIATSKKVEIKQVVIKLENDILKIKIEDFIKKYDNYINLIEEKRFDEINKMLK